MHPIRNIKLSCYVDCDFGGLLGSEDMKTRTQQNQGQFILSNLEQYVLNMPSTLLACVGAILLEQIIIL